MNSTSVTPYIPYPDITELLTMDNTGTKGITFECWIKYDSTNMSLNGSHAFILSIETNKGPFIALNDDRIGGMGSSPPGGASGTNTFDPTSNTPGFVSDMRI